MVRRVDVSPNIHSPYSHSVRRDSVCQEKDGNANLSYLKTDAISLA